jgi:hypothetical protein
MTQEEVGCFDSYAGPSGVWKQADCNVSISVIQIRVIRHDGAQQASKLLFADEKLGEDSIPDGLLKQIAPRYSTDKPPSPSILLISCEIVKEVGMFRSNRH